MKTKKYDILIIGELIGIDLIMAEHLSRKGLKCVVLRKKNNESYISPLNSYHIAFKKEDIKIYNNPLEFLKYAKNCKLIVSFGGALILALNKLILITKLIGLPPIFNIMTGSDMTELSIEDSLRGFAYRHYLKTVDLNICAPYPNALKNLIKLKIPNVVLLRYPTYLLMNYKPVHENRNSDKVLNFFHASHLDWGISDNGKNRNSTKGNDKFIRAFYRAIQEGLKANCVILDRGPDKELAKKIIKELDMEKYFIWKSHLNRDDLFKEFKKADVVVDQFDVGWPGAITIEAMSCSKPVMVYVNEECARLVYPDKIPVLNSRSEDEIYTQLLRCKDKSYLRNIGNEAYCWVKKYHYWEESLSQFLFYYTLYTGHVIVDYGWDKNDYKKT